METFKLILGILLFSIVALIAYGVLRTYVLDKIKVNKWIILIIALAVFIVPTLLWPTMPGYVARYIIPGIFVILFLWFMDLSGFLKHYDKPQDKSYNQYNKSNNTVIKPKAKPNRVKKKK